MARARRLRHLVLLASAALFAISALGISRLQVAHDPLAWLPVDDPTRSTFDTIDQQLGGSSTVDIIVHYPDGSNISKLALMQGLEKLEAHARAYREPGTGTQLVGNVTGVLDMIRESHRALQGGTEDQYRLPDSDRGISDMLFLAGSAGPEHLRRLATTNLSHARMTLRVLWRDGSKYIPLIEHIEAGIAKHMPPEVQVMPTGSIYAVGYTVNNVLTDLVRSFLLAFLVITVFLAIMLRSVKMAILAMGPNLLPILLVMGALGLFDVPVDMLCMMLGSIGLGIVVDDTIHFFHHVQHTRRAGGNIEAAIAHAFGGAGRAMTSTSAVLITGFMVYLAASLAPLQRFGSLVALVVAAALLSDLVLAPALLRTLSRSSKPQASTPPSPGAGSPGPSEPGSSAPQAQDRPAGPSAPER